MLSADGPCMCAHFLYSCTHIRVHTSLPFSSWPICLPAPLIVQCQSHKNTTNSETEGGAFFVHVSLPPPFSVPLGATGTRPRPRSHPRRPHACRAACVLSPE